MPCSESFGFWNTLAFVAFQRRAAQAVSRTVTVALWSVLTCVFGSAPHRTVGFFAEPLPVPQQVQHSGTQFTE